jgi:hypothetical protein
MASDRGSAAILHTVSLRGGAEAISVRFLCFAVEADLQMLTVMASLIGHAVGLRRDADGQEAQAS